MTQPLHAPAGSDGRYDIMHRDNAQSRKALMAAMLVSSPWELEAAAKAAGGSFVNIGCIGPK